MRVGYWQRVWLAFFGATVLLALLVQLVILPYAFPQWHAGDGLLKGGDWEKYHSLAKDLAERIDREGWSAWELRPQGYGIVGILGALYALTTPRPWTFIPIAAALHATATLVLALLLNRLLKNRRVSLWAVLPFFLFPTSLLWTTQPLKDGFSICGFILFVYGWILLIDIGGSERLEKKKAASALSLFLLGLTFIWLVRGYLLMLEQAVGVTVAIVLAIWALRRAWRKRLQLVGAGIVIFLVFVGAFFPGFLLRMGTERDRIWEGPQPVPGVEGEPAWTASDWLPDRVDEVFHILSQQRCRSSTLYPEAGSNIDEDVLFSSAGDVLAYVPRAAQIALFAPFPKGWFSEGTSTGGDLMRRVSGIEMVFSYLALLFLPVAIYRWRREPALWIALAFGVPALIIQPIFSVNVGTIVRLRYPYFMILVAMGTAGGISFLKPVAGKVRALFRGG